MLLLSPNNLNYQIDDNITIKGIFRQLFLMPSSFKTKVNGYFRKVNNNFTFKKGMTFKNGKPIVNGNYHIVTLDGLHTNVFYFNPIKVMKGFYMWSYQMVTNRNGTINLSNGDEDNHTPFAMPKNSVAVKFPKNATKFVPLNTNSIFLFTGEEYVSVALKQIENSTYGDLYEKAGMYFEEKKMDDYLLGITLSGGDRYWTIDKIERLASDIENDVIKYGNYKNYLKDSKTKYFNTICIDLERLSDSSPGSGITDKNSYEQELLDKFINCFIRIKNNGPWIIVVTEAHSGTFDATHNFIDGINKCKHVDYYSPQLYTWDYIGCNEYTRTKSNNYSWGKFYSSIIKNPQYTYRGSSMITPSLGFNETTIEVNGTYGRSSIADENWGAYIDKPEKIFSGSYTGLYKSAGTNIGNKPFFEITDSILTSDDGDVFPNINNPDFHINYPNGIDNGAADFFGQMFKTTENQTIGGSIQFSNGILTF